MLQRTFHEFKRAHSPELEHKDEFAASSLWKMAVKANQEDFREVFKNAAQQESSEDLESKLRDLINSHKSQKHKPTIEPTSQVSPRTIKYLCNMVMQQESVQNASKTGGNVGWHGGTH